MLDADADADADAGADAEPIKVTTSADAEAIASLLALLSSSSPPFARSDLEAMVADPANTILAVRVGGKIVDITTLVVFRVATRVRAFIDDGVVRDASQLCRLSRNRILQRRKIAYHVEENRDFATASPL